MSADFTPEKEDLKILTPFKMQVLTNFPYIEADFDALTNYQLLCKVVEYLNTVITNENEVTEQVTSLYNAYVSLQNYVNAYFDNLDVQEEVNKKLDEMAEDGTITDLIKEYIDPIFNTYKNENTIAYNNFTNNINSQISVIDAKVDSATSGSPLVATSTSGMTETDRIYVNTTDGYWYYYNGTAWAQGGVYQSTSLADSDVHINNLDTNLKNELYTIKTTISELYGTFPTVDKYMYLSSVGTYSYDTSNERIVTIKTPLKVHKGDSIQAPSGYQLCVCEYNGIPSAETFTSYSGYIMNGDPYIIQSDECYILITFGYLQGTGDVADVDIIYNIIFNVYASRNDEQDTEILILNNLTDNLNLTLSTINELYGPFPTVLKYKYLANNGDISSDYTNERIVTITTPLKAKKGDIIQAPSGYQLCVCEYSSDETTMSQLLHYSGYIVNSDPYVIQSDECYILITFGYLQGTGDVADVNIIYNIIFDFKTNTIDYLKNKIMINNDYQDDRFYRNIIKTFVDNYYKGLNDNYNRKIFNRNTKYKYVIECFDELKNQFPNYITKSDLGVASGVDSDNNQYRIYEYIIKGDNINLNKEGWNIPTYPKVLIIQGQHGFEKSNVYGMYYFIYDLLNNADKNPVLAFIRENVEIHLIPVVVPFAWDNNTYYNANGVAGNRNYDMPGWQQGSASDPNTYGGAYPFSEPETRIVRDFVRRNKDAILFIDSHTNGQYSVQNYSAINWISLISLNDLYYQNLSNVVKTHLNQLNLEFRNEYNLETSDYIGSVTFSSDNLENLGGYADCWVTMKENIIGITLEGFNGFPNRDSFIGEVYKANSEILGNFIIKFLLYYSNLS